MVCKCPKPRTNDWNNRRCGFNEVGAVVLSLRLRTSESPCSTFAPAKVCARKDHLVYRDEMGIMNYLAGTVETVLRVKKAWQLHLGHVLQKDKRERSLLKNWKQRVWKKADGRDVGLIQVSGRQFFIQSR